MSEIIQVLEKMGCDASLNNEHELTALLANADISNSQQQAIIAKDADQLAENSDEISKIRFFIPIIVADDEDEEQANKVENKTAVNF